MPSGPDMTPDKIKIYEMVLNTKHKICAGYPFQRADHGDSGGPLLYRRNGVIYQIGIAEAISTVEKLSMFMINHFDGFHISHFSAIYTRVSSYCDWIEMVTNNEAKCVSMPELPKPVENLKTVDGGSNAMGLNCLAPLILISVLKYLI